MATDAWIHPTRHGKRGRYALIWPKDGKHNSKFGRLRDILSNEGPDIFVATHRGPGLGWDAPRKSQWSMWSELDTPGHDPWVWNSTISNDRIYPWAKRPASRRYDFWSRKYKDWNRGLWSDAQWQPGAKRRDQVPLRLRTSDGMHWVPQLGALGGDGYNDPARLGNYGYPGGDEYGRGGGW